MATIRVWLHVLSQEVPANVLIDLLGNEGATVGVRGTQKPYRSAGTVFAQNVWSKRLAEVESLDVGAAVEASNGQLHRDLRRVSSCHCRDDLEVRLSISVLDAFGQTIEFDIGKVFRQAMYQAGVEVDLDFPVGLLPPSLGVPTDEGEVLLGLSHPGQGVAGYRSLSNDMWEPLEAALSDHVQGNSRDIYGRNAFISVLVRGELFRPFLYLDAARFGALNQSGIDNIHLEVGAVPQ